MHFSNELNLRTAKEVISFGNLPELRRPDPDWRRFLR